MDMKKIVPNASMIAAILFAVQGVFSLFGLFSSFTFASFLLVVAVAYSAVMLFLKRRDVLAVIGFAVMALCALFSYKYVYGFLSFLRVTLTVLERVSIALIVLVGVTDYLPQIRSYAEKFWFAPGVLAAARIVINLLINVGYIFDYIEWGYGSHIFSLLLSTVFTVVFIVVLGAAELLTAVWALNKQDLTIDLNAPVSGGYQNTYGTSNSNAGSNNAAKTAGRGEIYMSLFAHILLLLFTFGIWSYVWIYRVTKYLNCVEGEEYRNPTTKLLLCIFVPFYSIYWTYKSAQRIDKLASTKGIQSDIATLCLILAIFVGIVPPILMQDKLNHIAEAGSGNTKAPQYAAASAQYTAPAAPQYAPPASPAAPQYAPAAKEIPQNTSNIYEELRVYKNLLDQGLITQEDYDAKKKQLLGL